MKKNENDTIILTHLLMAISQMLPTYKGCHQAVTYVSFDFGLVAFTLAVSCHLSIQISLISHFQLTSSLLACYIGISKITCYQQYQIQYWLVLLVLASTTSTTSTTSITSTTSSQSRTRDLPSARHAITRPSHPSFVPRASKENQCQTTCPALVEIY